MNSLRRSELTYLKGVGPKRAELLEKELGLKTFYDLVHHFPTHYVDRSTVYKVKDLTGEMPMVQLRGRFVTMNVVGEGAKTRLVALFTDGTGTMEVVWFTRIRRLREMYQTGQEYVIFGKPEQFKNSWSMVHPEVDTTTAADSAPTT